MNIRTKLLLGFIVVVFSITGMSLFQQPPRAEYRTVKIGVLAKRGPEVCLAKWSPTAEYLSSKIQDHSFSIVTLDFDEIHPAVEKGEVDFVLANSSFYVALEHLFGASRIATLENLTSGKGHTVFGGVVFCRADRKDMRRLIDLKGKTFMAVKETSFGGWQMAWRELKENGIDPHEDFTSLSFGGTHDAVVYAVRDGQVDAGTVRTDALERLAKENRIHMEDFHVFSHGLAPQHACEIPFVHSTEAYPEWPFAKVRHTSDELAKKVTVALLEMSSDDPAAGAAKCVGWTIPLNYQPVHDCLKELRIGPYKDYGEITAEDVVRKYWLWIAGVIVVVSVVIMILAYVHKLNRRLSETLTISQDEIVKRKRAEEGIREANEHFRLVFETANIGICLVDIDGRLRLVNEQMCTMCGYTKEELEGMTTKNITHPDYSDVTPQFIQRASSGEIDHQRFIKRYIHKDGNTVWAEVSSTIVRDVQGNPLHFISYVLDITERKQAEEACAASAIRRRILMEQSRDGIVVLDQDGSVYESNQRFAEMLGFSPEEVSHLHVWDWEFQFTREQLRDMLRNVDETGANFETQHRRKDGTIYKVEISTNGAVFAGEKLIFCVCRDITERKQADIELRQAEEQYRRLFESSQDALMIIKPPSWKFTSGNAVCLEMFKVKNLIEFTSLGPWSVSPEQQPDGCSSSEKAKKMIETAMREGSQSFEWVHKRLDGREFPATVLLTRVELVDETILQCTVRDLTTQKLAEKDRAALQAQLVQSEKLASVGQLSAGVAHEINNPMGFISSNLGTMKKYLIKIRHFLESNSGQDSDEQREITEIVTDFGDAIAESLEGADRVKKIVADLKGFARADSGKMESADLNAALESTLNIVWNQIKYTCQVEKDLGELPTVKCYRGHISQVIMNMLVNAGQAIGDGPGTIRVRTWADDRQCYISVKDDGCGIAQEHIDKIFDPFYTTKDVGKGTGLGLSVSYDIVKEHGGRIEVQSEVGQGTEFVVSLPIEPSMVTTVETPVTNEECIV